GLAVEPAVLLLDEPLSALDLKLRQHMRTELRSIQKKTGVTFIYITHDQGEALTMSDRIAVMNHGRVEQVGPGDEIYATPASAFVASFVGETNAIPGRLKAADGKRAWIETPLGAFTARNPHGVGEGREAMLFIRPEAMRFGDGENRIDARVTRRDLEGAFVNIFAEAGGRELSLHLTNTGDAGRNLEGPQSLTFDTGDALILPKGELARTGKELVEA
ncbi:MAG: ABC transporter ATP-binding protein, partial [Pseudomonadota bacterium]